MTAGRRGWHGSVTAVPIGRRILFAERRRAWLTVFGVAASLLVVLLLVGIFAGAIERVTYYIRTSGGDVFISQAGVRTMHMSSSALPPDTVAQAASIPGVAWAAPIGFSSGSVAGPAGRQLSYVIGYDPATGHGGPAMLAAGHAPGLGEAVLDQQAADDLAVRLGGTLTVLGTPLRVVGLSTGGTSITNTTVFVTTQQFARISGPRISYVLLGAEPGVDAATLAGRVSAAMPGVTVQTRDEFASSEANVVTDMSADLLRLMSTVGLLIALAVIALGLMAATLSRMRDFAVLKALGATPSRLIRTVIGQVVWTVGLAALLAGLLGVVLGWVIPMADPAMEIKITGGSVVRTALEALAVGLLAALLPLRRIAALDPATAFRENR